MRPILKSFAMFLRQIRNDSMLVIVCFAPILYISLFHFAIPRIETLICRYFSLPAALSPYYRMFDLLLIMLTPFMFCFASAMLMLEEYDGKLSSYLSVTPVGKNGYLFSRMLLPSLIAGVVSLLLLVFFSFADWALSTLIWVTLLSGFSAIIQTMLIFSYSRNKVEGMAIAKISGLLMLGLPIPFLMHTNLQYLFSLVPSFWISTYVLTEDVWALAFGFLTSGIFIFFIHRKFLDKLR